MLFYIILIVEYWFYVFQCYKSELRRSCILPCYVIEIFFSLGYWLTIWVFVNIRIFINIALLKLGFLLILSCSEMHLLISQNDADFSLTLRFCGLIFSLNKMVFYYKAIVFQFVVVVWGRNYFRDLKYTFRLYEYNWIFFNFLIFKSLPYFIFANAQLVRQLNW